MRSDKRTGGCLCGAARYETAGAPFGVFHCHCLSCRRHTGAPVATMAVHTEGQVAFSGLERQRRNTSPGVFRAYCGDCGTPLTWETEHPRFGPVCAIHVSTFDAPESLTPTAHSFYGERIPWFDVADDLPRYEGFVEMERSGLVRRGPAADRD